MALTARRVSTEMKVIFDVSYIKPYVGDKKRG